jgi:hypothetical protein
MFAAIARVAALTSATLFVSSTAATIHFPSRETLTPSGELPSATWPATSRRARSTISSALCSWFET